MIAVLPQTSVKFVSSDCLKLYTTCDLKPFTHFTLHCYRIDAWAIRRPWLTFVNAHANSILGRFCTARNSKICFVRLAYGSGGQLFLLGSHNETAAFSGGPYLMRVEASHDL